MMVQSYRSCLPSNSGLNERNHQECVRFASGRIIRESVGLSYSNITYMSILPKWCDPRLSIEGQRCANNEHQTQNTIHLQMKMKSTSVYQVDICREQTLLPRVAFDNFFTKYRRIMIFIQVLLNS
jgi:hypothetical protein